MDNGPEARVEIVGGGFEPDRLVVVRPPLIELLAPRIVPPPVELLRPGDLVHLTCSFVNLRVKAGTAGEAPALVPMGATRPAYLVVDHGSQHITEHAVFESTLGFTPLHVPVRASISGSSRLVFVADRPIEYSTEGLLRAMGELDLRVAPHAVAPPAPKLDPSIFEVFEGINITKTLGLTSVVRRSRAGGAVVPRSEVVSQLTALGRIRATAGHLEHRFGTDGALASTAVTAAGARLGFEKLRVTTIPKLTVLPPLPRAPEDDETALELPWRLILSPNRFAAWAHSPLQVEHNGRVELWHSRLGVRRPAPADGSAPPTVDERAPARRTVRAIWARDFDRNPAWAFQSPPPDASLPKADRSDDVPNFRMALRSRDRIMLVHETSNFHLKTTGRRPKAWVPPAVPTDLLMLTALGGWLHSEVKIDPLPAGSLSIEEWKHRAAMGRDHEVKVVIAGFLLPFGHKASKVIVTERRIEPNTVGVPTAYLFQREFVIVRQLERTFEDTRELPGGARIHLGMPLRSVRILTRTTPMLDEGGGSLPSSGTGELFVPRVGGADFRFQVQAVDVEGGMTEFGAPMVFMERTFNQSPDDEPGLLQSALDTYNGNVNVNRRFDLRGQKVAYADSTTADDTTLETASLAFKVATADFLQDDQNDAMFVPYLDEARAVVPAMSALAGAAAPVRLGFHPHYAKDGFAGNAAQVFLKTLDAAPMNFGGQGDRSGGFVTPSIMVKGLSRLTGPIGGDIEKAITDPGNFDVGSLFDGISAKLFGLIPLKDLFGELGFTPDKVPSFVAQALDVATTLKANLERLADVAQAEAASIGAIAGSLEGKVDAFLGQLVALANDLENPPDLEASLTGIADDLQNFIDAVGASPLPHAQKVQVAGVASRVRDQLTDVAAVTAAAQALVNFAKGLQLPEVLTARLDWSTEIDPWPDPGSKAIFKPLGPGGKGRITLAVEIQAPTVPGKDPSALVSCSISPFDLNLVAPTNFLILHFEKIEFTIVAGKKPDVNVVFKPSGGIEFAGPLSFVNTLKDIIPFDGFSDPPYLDVSSSGIKAGFDLSIPDLAVGIFALSNISLGAGFIVPFVDESIEVSFNFCTRENPFRLQVSLFAGGGFFGVTITPEKVRILEAAFEFGAAISINLGVASGGVSIMAGIYFKLEDDDATLTGYFRLRGEVDVLGLISASIELYLELSYETKSGKAVGRAVITVEVEVFFFSFSVEIECEKKFAGANGDPTFDELMGAASPGDPRPWDAYCMAFADE